MPTISRLLLQSCPTTVARLIVSVAVDAVKRVLRRWTRAHIAQKGGKVVSPFLAHCYSMRAIPLERIVLRIKAPFFCRLPSLVLRACRHGAFCVSVFARCRNLFLKITTAAFRIAGVKIGGTYYGPIPAVADAQPKTVFVLAGVAKNSQPSDSTSRIINFVTHTALIALLAAPVYAAEPEDKDLTILRLQKIIAEQSMGELLRDERVKEYIRIRENYQRLMAEIEKREKAPKEKPEYSPRDWGEK